ncbi:MAG: LacI family DNA-binding transcriptional regulator [Lentisphaeria bacterium]|nr:LacI family DNA-binding transcriptional regulator [Lentisphaeria bacterium]
MKKVTLKDIAASAGVSTALVSNYLNHHPSARMSDQTREKIDRALKELNYHGSDIARSLRTGRSHIIGYFTGNLRNEVTQNEMLEIYNAAEEENYRVIVEFATDLNHPVEKIRAFQARGYDALIVSGNFDQEITEQIAELPVPTVILNTNSSASLPGKMLRYDYRIAVREAIDYLKGQGHTGIYYQTRYFEPDDQRYLEFAESVSEKNIWCLPYRNVSPEEWKAFMQEHPDCTAMLHLNDFLAMKTLQNCMANGMTVPEDFSVVGFDNIHAAEYATPGLSTISRPLSEAAELAVNAVLAELEKKPYELPEVLPCQFIRRNSVK